MSGNADLCRLTHPMLEVIDYELAAAAEPIHRRPLIAAMMYVHECVLEVRGGSKDDYLTQEWFGEFAKIASEWYEARYGADLLRHPESVAKAVVEIRSTPFLVHIPIVPTRPGRQPGTAILHFTSELLHDEDPTTWIVRPPPLAQLSDVEMVALRGTATETSILVRSIRNRVMGAELQSEQAQALAAALSLHLDSAAESICALTDQSRSTAAWSFTCRWSSR